MEQTLNAKPIFKEKVLDIITLLKLPIAILVALTMIPSWLISSNTLPTFDELTALIFGVMFLAISGGILNQIIESSTDKKMSRTARRPLVKNTVTIPMALALSCGMGFAGFLLMLVKLNVFAACIALFAHVFYSSFYTLWLKPNTPHNIVIGGIAGSVGPLIGATAVLGYPSLESLLLSAFIFLWTPPHFWALAIHYLDDYKKSGLPMMPVVIGVHETKKLMVQYCFYLLPIFPLMYLFDGRYNFFTLLFSFLLTVIFLIKNIKFLRLKDNHIETRERAMKLFRFSCHYLFFVFIALLLDSFWQKGVF